MNGDEAHPGICPNRLRADGFCRNSCRSFFTVPL